MRFSLLRVVVLLLGVGLVSTFAYVLTVPAQSPTQKAIPQEAYSYRNVVKQVLPAVVSVEATTKHVATPLPNFRLWRDDSRLPQEFRRFFDDFDVPFQGSEFIQRGLGSGFIVDPKGVVLTNYHVVRGASEVTVRLQSGQTFTSSDIKGDATTDLAVIRFATQKPLPYLELADSSTMEIGDRVLAMGAPFGLAGSVTSGIISGTARKLNNSVYEDYVQTDAAINPGNSGGPLVNLEGKVVGINTAIRSNSGGSQGVGLAISSNLARSILDKLVKDGAVHRGYLGVLVQKLDAEVSARLNVPGGGGVLVAKVMDDSPAAKGGIRPGDVVTAIGGQVIKEPADLQRRVMDAAPKTSLQVTVWRDGKSLDLPITIEEQIQRSAGTKMPTPPDLAEDRSDVAVAALGLEFSDRTPALARRYQLAETGSGAVITHVEKGSLAAQAEMLPGAVLLKVDGAAVTSAAAAQKLLEQASLERGILLQLEYPRGGVGYVMVKAPGAVRK